MVASRRFNLPEALQNDSKTIHPRRRHALVGGGLSPRRLPAGGATGLLKTHLRSQGNRVKKCGDEACEEVVIHGT
jgi:hypothetical protein